MTRHLIPAILFSLLSAGAAQAQGVPNPFSGMSRDSDQPISISADSTTADMHAQTATYAGNVHVTQGNLHLRSDSLSIKANKGTIEHIEAAGGVILASPQGEATGSTAVYDISQRVVKLSGKVTLVKGQNAMQGTSLVVNLATGKADLAGGGADGRVTGIFVPNKPLKLPASAGGSKDETPSKDPASKP